MFPTHKRIVLLHLSGQVIRTTADHPFYVQGKGCTPVSHLHVGELLHAHDGKDLPVEAITATDEENVVFNLPEESLMPKQTLFNGPIIGFAAGTPILTPKGPVPIEELRPGDFIQTGPNEQVAQDDEAPEQD